MEEVTWLFDTFNQFDRLGRDLFSMANGAMGAPVDIQRDEDRYLIAADLPGADPSSVDVTVEGKSLTIRAERTNASTKEDAQWLVRERGSWNFVRPFTLGDDIDPDGIKADYHDGVLTVVVPVVEGARPHKIPVAIGRGQQKALRSATAGESRETDEGKAEAAHSLAS